MSFCFELYFVKCDEGYGYEVNKIETVADTELKTQEDADKVARRLGLYR